MTAFPSLGHVAITVADLSKSVPWYQRLIGAEPVIDEDTGPYRHVVFALADTLFSLHEFPDRITDVPFDERRVGLDHISFGCADRAELLRWQAHLDDLGVRHGGVVDAYYGSGVSFRDPDNIPLEFFSPPS